MVIYDTKKYESIEAQVAKKLADHLNCTYKKRPAFSWWDYTLYDKHYYPYAYLEIKSRNQVYNEMILSYKKYKTLFNLYQQTDVKFLLAYFIKDTIYWAYITDPEPKTKEAGRTDRNDPNDIEKCAFIPLKIFNTLEIT